LGFGSQGLHVVLLLSDAGLDSVGHSEPLAGALVLEVLGNREGYHFERRLLMEQVKNVKELVVELCFLLGHENGHHRIPLFIRLVNAREELRAKEYKNALLCNPDKNVQKEHDMGVESILSVFSNEVIIEGWHIHVALVAFVSLNHELEESRRNAAVLAGGVIYTEMHHGVLLSDSNHDDQRQN